MAVTALGGLLAVASGAGPLAVARLTLVFLVGQLSIGWSNDWVDAARDAEVARADKPVARGQVDRRTVGRAALVAAVLTLPLSFSLGLRAGVAHLVAVGAGWVYNLGVKATVWSWAPYAVCFGLLPAVVTLSLPGSPRPARWAMAAGRAAGSGHTWPTCCPDLEDDRRHRRPRAAAPAGPDGVDRPRLRGAAAGVGGRGARPAPGARAGRLGGPGDRDGARPGRHPGGPAQPRAAGCRSC